MGHRVEIRLLGRDPTQSHVPLENRGWVMLPCKVVAGSGCKSATHRGGCTSMGVASALNSMMTAPDAAGDVHPRSIIVYKSSGSLLSSGCCVFCTCGVKSSCVFCLLEVPIEVRPSMSIIRSINVHLDVMMTDAWMSPWMSPCLHRAQVRI